MGQRGSVPIHENSIKNLMNPALTKDAPYPGDKAQNAKVLGRWDS